MKIINFFHLKNLYIFFIFLSLFLFFFSTDKARGKAFEIKNIEISRPFKMNFDKIDVIDEGFKRAFSELTSLIVNSSDRKKIGQIEIKEIKGMIESFSIKEEKFIDETYFLNLGVSFNKRKIFKYLEAKNIFPSVPRKKKFLFFPIIIDEINKELIIFSENEIFNSWNDYKKNYHLIEYILPSEDLEDFNLIKEKYGFIEEYDFKDITSKYYLENSIITLIFKNEKGLRILSRINIKDNINLKNQFFSNINIDNSVQLEDIIWRLKMTYEDHWKISNQINTSMKFPITIKLDNSDNLKISNFEKTLNKTDLVYDFYVLKFDKDFVFFQIIFNGTPNIFLKYMLESSYNFNTQNKIWVMK